MRRPELARVQFHGPQISKEAVCRRAWRDTAASFSCWSNYINASCMLVFATNRLIHFVCAALSIKSRIESRVLRKRPQKKKSQDMRLVKWRESTCCARDTHDHSNSRMFSNSDCGASSHFPSMRRPRSMSRRAAR